jgi:hypothetical protein
MALASSQKGMGIPGILVRCLIILAMSSLSPTSLAVATFIRIRFTGQVFKVSRHR